MNALIGYTGFIGSNLRNQINFDLEYNSSNISKISKKKISHLVCAGLPGTKWYANKNPDEDLKKINLLKRNLNYCNVEKITYLSTIDVYENPILVNESTNKSYNHHIYGSNRSIFEDFILENFKNAKCIRLPIVFGSNFKKNYLYDLINFNNLEKICLKSKVQFYDVKNLGKDIEKFWNIKSKVVNLSTEPVLVEDIVNRFFPHTKVFCKGNDTFKTNMTSSFCKEGYFYTKKDIFKSIDEFLK